MNRSVRFILAGAVLMGGAVASLAAQTSPSVTTTAHASAQPSTLAPIPGGLPAHFGYGLFNGDITTMHSGIPYDYRYQYLAGGVNTGGGWQTWGTNYAQNYVSDSRQHGYIPGFIYYNILQSAPSYDEYSNLNNASTMRSYYTDFKTLMQQMNDGQPAFVDVEPDLDGVMMQHSSNTNDNAALQPTKVGGSGMPELSGMADNFRNYWQALAHIRDLYAPNVVLGQDLSIWGADYDLTIALRNDPNYDWQTHADRTATYHNSFGPGYGLNFFSPLDRDAAYYQTQQGSDRWWHDSTQEPSFNTMAAWLGRIDSTTNKRTLMWQVPNGNTKYRTENNSTGHYQDNRAEYFLDATNGRSHMQSWANQGVIGVMFGAGVGSQSHYFDAQGDGVTNPAAINGNNLVATVADDDGGYIRNNVSAYYSAGTLPLPGSGPNPTPTNTVVPTNTPVPPTSTPTRTRTATPTRTSVPPTATATRTAVPPTATATPGTRSLVGHITWQGRPAQPSNLQQLPITLTLKLGANDYEFAATTTDANGQFTYNVSSVPSGTYAWRVKGPKYLANSGTVTLSGAPTTSFEAGTAPVGDANNDNVVNTVDYNIVRNALGTSAGQSGYDDRADFNGDQVVNMVDYNLMRNNLGHAGAPPPAP